MVVIDPSTKTIAVSVRDLAAEPGFGRIGFGREGWASFAVGSRVHERVQAARAQADPAYQKEIHLDVKIPVAGWTASVVGRIDGYRTSPEGAHLGSSRRRRSCRAGPPGRTPGLNGTGDNC